MKRNVLFVLFHRIDRFWFCLLRLRRWSTPNCHATGGFSYLHRRTHHSLVPAAEPTHTHTPTHSPALTHLLSQEKAWHFSKARTLEQSLPQSRGSPNQRAEVGPKIFPPTLWSSQVASPQDGGFPETENCSDNSPYPVPPLGDKGDEEA